MIEELTKYIEGVQQQFPLNDFIDEPSTGLHIMLEVRNNEIQLIDKEVYQPKKGKEAQVSDFLLKECLPRELHIDFIESHKALIGKAGKKIHSASPFALKIRKKSFDEEWLSWLFTQKEITSLRSQISSLASKSPYERQSFFKQSDLEEKKLDAINISLKEYDEFHELKGEELIKKKAELINEKIYRINPQVYELLTKYFERANDICLIQNSIDNKKEVLEKYQTYLIENFQNLLTSLSDKVARLGKEDNIIVLLKNFLPNQYESTNSNYLKEYIFNVDYFNKSFNDEEFGLNGYMNTASDNKPYLRHLTAPFDINYRIPQTKALLLYNFERYRKANAFKTNPLPIFIDHSELNDIVINVVKEEGNDVKFNTIIRKLFEHSKKDIGNYYLFYFDFRGELKDLDFVSAFSYNLNLDIKQVIPDKKEKSDVKVDNVFEFELKVLQPIFSNQLIQKRKENKISYKYFDKVDNNPKFITATQWNLLMKYRKTFYDWVYKSRKQAITKTMFHDILNRGIIDDIRNDEYTDGYHTKQNDIITKLNIWFCLWYFFGDDKQSNDLTMANKIIKLQERLRLIRENKENEHIETDEEFAFTVGQIIYFLLDKSKAGNKTHALLEPFIQKTNVEELKRAITTTFNAYKHEIDFGKGRYEKLCSEVLAYEINGRLKDLTPIILAGYFSNSTIYEKSNNN